MDTDKDSGEAGSRARGQNSRHGASWICQLVEVCRPAAVRSLAAYLHSNRVSRPRAKTEAAEGAAYSRLVALVARQKNLKRTTGRPEWKARPGAVGGAENLKRVAFNLADLQICFCGGGDGVQPSRASLGVRVVRGVVMVAAAHSLLVACGNL